MPADTPKRPMPDEDAAELAGHMYEDCEIQMAIESGQFKTLADVLAAVKARATSISEELKAAGKITARHITPEEFAVQWSLHPRHRTGHN